MKKLIFLFLFISSICFSQDYSDIDKNSDKTEKSKIEKNWAYAVNFDFNSTEGLYGVKGFIWGKNFGFYIGITSNFEGYDKDTYYSNISASTAEYTYLDPVQKVIYRKENYSFGVSYLIYECIAPYIGISSYTKTQYRQYYDGFHILGKNGSYWVTGFNDNNIDSWGIEYGINFLILDLFSISISKHSEIPGVNIGLGFGTTF